MPTPTHGLERLYTFTDAAREMGLSRSTIYALVKAGELKTVKVGHRRRISRKAMQDYERSHTSA